MFPLGPAVTSQASVWGKQSAWSDDNRDGDHGGDPGPGRV